MNPWEVEYEKPVTPVRDLGAVRQSQMEAAKTFATNVGRGATLGLAKYPAALTQMGVRALTGAPVGTYKENLADVAQFYREQEQASPTAALAGQVTGGLLTVPGFGGTIPAMIGRSAVAGGVSGFTANEGMDNALRDVAIGTGLGALTGGVAGGVTKLGRKAQENVVREVYVGNQLGFREKYANLYNQNVAQLQPAINRELQRYPAGSVIPEEKIVREIAKSKPNVLSTRAEQKEALEALKNRRLAQQAENRAATAKKLTGQKLFDETEKSLRFEAQRKTGSLVEMAKETLPTIAIGGAGGAGLAQLAGMDPVTGGSIGAGLGGLVALKQAAAPVFVKKLGAVAAKSPITGVTPETVARGATIGITPQIVREEPEIEPWTMYDEQPVMPVEDNRTRLQRLADDARARFQGQQ